LRFSTDREVSGSVALSPKICPFATAVSIHIGALVVHQQLFVVVESDDYGYYPVDNNELVGMG